MLKLERFLLPFLRSLLNAGGGDVVLVVCRDSEINLASSTSLFSSLYPSSELRSNMISDPRKMGPSDTAPRSCFLNNFIRPDATASSLDLSFSDSVTCTRFLCFFSFEIWSSGFRCVLSAFCCTLRFHRRWGGGEVFSQIVSPVLAIPSRGGDPIEE